jgi:BlaI family transcriptional regulator, penicillinase repressor
MAPRHSYLSRREREIMDILYRRGSASAAQIREDLARPPSYSAVRAMLSRLEEKKQLRHHKEGRNYVYFPTVALTRARRMALGRLIQTFFAGSVENAVSLLLDSNAKNLSPQALDRMAQLIEKAKREG